MLNDANLIFIRVLYMSCLIECQGRYGQDCSKQCGGGCDQGLCHHTSGECNCTKPGFIGDKCDQGKTSPTTNILKKKVN